jgi:SulP family sulfate permease
VWGYRAPIGLNPSLRHYQRSWLMTDVAAGVTVGALTIPSALGYAEVAGLPPVYGLYAAMVPMVVFALVGSSRHLVLGPDGAFAALIGATLAPLAAGNQERAVALAPVLALLVGGLFLVFGLARVGFLANFLSRPLLSGFMTGLAITILVGQLPRLLGISVDADATIPKLIETIQELGDTELWSLVLGGTTLGFALVIGRLQPRLPAAVLLLLIGAGLVAVFALEKHGVGVVGDIPTGLPPVEVPAVTWTDMRQMFPGALALAVLGFADAVLQSRRYAEQARYEVDPNRDLVGLGVANLAGSFASGYPVGASASRSGAALAGGGRSSLVPIVGAVVIALVLLVFAPVIEHMPVPVLAGVVIAAALRIMSFGEIRQLWPHRRPELVVAVAALVGVVVTGVLTGVAIALGLSLVNFMRRAAAPHDAVLGRRPDRPGWGDVRRGAVSVPGLLIYRFDAPLFFANAQVFRDRVLALVAACEPAPRWLLVHASAIGEMDVTATDTLRRLFADLDEQGITIAVSGAHARLRDRLSETPALVPPERLYMTIGEAVEAYHAATGPAPPPTS